MALIERDSLFGRLADAWRAARATRENPGGLTGRDSMRGLAVGPRRGRRALARRADLPADEIVAVADTVIVPPDPAPVAS
jgi:hypothetical protein